jgi:hypothetical protein
LQAALLERLLLAAVQVVQTKTLLAFLEPQIQAVVAVRGQAPI